jgi:adenine-specific DNA-methyltransferase
MSEVFHIAKHFSISERAVVFEGDCIELLKNIPNNSMQLIVTSPPYNLGKEYERKLKPEEYFDQQKKVITECARVLKNTGSICWQVGNFVDSSSIIPIDTILYPIFRDLGFKLRNRIVWHFEHGLHASKRFSGRYETILWFTKTEDYVFNLDPIRVPQKYPGKKYFKGPKKGQYSSNPLGKNPGDLWIFPNVKSNHVEKTIHPCQFPVELVDRIVLSMTKKDDWVLDPFLGVGTTIVSAVRNNRRGAGAEVIKKYVTIAQQRISEAKKGTLPIRLYTQPVFDPQYAGKNLTTAPWLKPLPQDNGQLKLMERPKHKYGKAK